MRGCLIKSVAEQLAALRADKPKRDQRGRDQRGRKQPARKQPGRKRPGRKRASRVSERKFAVLDFETNPFDNTSCDPIIPFLCVLYPDPETWHEENNGPWAPIVIWDENYSDFLTSVISAIENLPNTYTIYAHNGAKFDWMFLITRLRGEVKFKGRGIMSATIGRHDIRDSLHLIPVSLRRAGQKDDIDYQWMRAGERDKHRAVITIYCIADCKYTLAAVKHFIADYGYKMSIGQAAMSELTKHYETKTIGPYWDDRLREFYHGGRVECLKGAGVFDGDYRTFDVNSMYPAVMRNYEHPIGNGSHYSSCPGAPHGVTADTVFIKLECDNNGALLGIDRDKTLTSEIKHGVFYTTIHEYKMALELGLISNIILLHTYDCTLRTNFAKFVDPLYAQRAEWTRRLKAGEFIEGSEEYLDAKRQALFLKLILNNAYGKFAQDPRGFKEAYLTDGKRDARGEVDYRNIPYDIVPRDERDERDLVKINALKDRWGEDYIFHTAGLKREGWGDLPGDFSRGAEPCWIWFRPAGTDRGFFNVGTAASITGAARAELMRELHYAVDPVYCDTDSITCKSLGPNAVIHQSELGAWKMEGEHKRLIINGKKSYEFINADGTSYPRKNAHKGAELSLDEITSLVVDGSSIVKTARAPTIKRDGTQVYIKRTARTTAKRKAQNAN